MLGSRYILDSWQELAQTLRTGKTGIEITYGASAWEYIADHPEERSYFQDAMVNITATDAPVFARAVDCSRVKRVCDVGGGYGTLLAHVLAHNQHLQGVLLVPDGCDVYLLRQVIHDWDDPRAEKILGNVRAAMKTGQRMLVYEMQRPERVSQHPLFSLDLMMMVMTDNGRERSVTELEALLSRCGFRPVRVIPLAAPLSVLEGIAV